MRATDCRIRSFESDFLCQNPRALRLALAAVVFLSTIFAGAQKQKLDNNRPGALAITEKYGELPLSFEANEGQVDPKVRFLTRGGGYSLFLTDSEAVLALRTPGRAENAPHKVKDYGAQTFDVVRMQVRGANRNPCISGDALLAGTVNYFLGNDPAKWRTRVPTYNRVRYADVYPGIDLVYYGNQHQLEYDFVVAPGANIRPIRLHFAGVGKLQLDEHGNLKVIGKNGKITFKKPVAYQLAQDQRTSVEAHFALLANNSVTFVLGAYDKTKTVVIDPVLAYSTFLGGSGGNSGNFTDNGTSLAVDASGNAYIGGYTWSPDFPITTGSFQATDPGITDGNFYTSVGFVSKLNATGSALIYSTYIGGNGSSSYTGNTLNAGGGDDVNALAIDSSGNVYLTGATWSSNFPVTTGAIQPTNKAFPYGFDAWIAKLNAAGTALLYSTYLGGTAHVFGNANVYGDAGLSITMDPNGDAFVAGYARSIDFPVTAGAFQSVNKASANYGTNAWIAEVNPDGTALIFSTYLGGSGNPLYYSFIPLDAVNGMALNTTGDIFVSGLTVSSDFPVTSGAFQTVSKAAPNNLTTGFVAEFNPTGNGLIYSTLVGGSGTKGVPNGSALPGLGDVPIAMALDGSNNVFLAGTTASTDFPVTTGAFQTVDKEATAGLPTGFVCKLNATGSALTYATYLGGSGDVDGERAQRIIFDDSGNAYVTGYTNSPDFPVTSDAYQSTNKGLPNHAANAFLTELNPGGTALVYSTYFGGSGNTSERPLGTSGDAGYGIFRDASGAIYIAGTTYSADFPTTAGAFQTTNKGAPGGNSNAFITKFTLGTTTTLIGTTTSLSADANPQLLGTKVTFTANVTTASGTGVPTGKVTFGIDGAAGTAVTLDSTAHASYATSSLAAGSHTITARYSGDTTYSASTGTLTETIIGAAATISVVSGSGQTANVGTAFSQPLVVIVKDANGNPVPGVIVNFVGSALSFSSATATTAADGTASVMAIPTAAAALTAAATTTGVTGSANFALAGVAVPPPVTATPTFSPAAGTYTSIQSVTISDSTTGAMIFYTTDGSTPTSSSTPYTAPITVSHAETIQAIAVASGFANSTVASATYTINLPPPTFTLSASPTGATVQSGQSTGVTLTITPQNGFTQTISFACSGLPAGGGCSFSPNTVTPGSGAVTDMMTISTSSSSAKTEPTLVPFWIKLAAGVTMALLIWPFRKRRAWRLWAFLFLITMGALFVGCGGGKKSQTYSVNVTASGGNVTQSATISLDVTK
jgi:hypothetical protein